MNETIDGLIDAWAANADLKLNWLIPRTLRERFLPLYIDWTHVIGLKPDGTFVNWDHDAIPPAPVLPMTDPYWTRIALFQGAQRHPELKPLLPARPAEALDCQSCRGTGTIAAWPQLQCKCGGSGWLLPGE